MGAIKDVVDLINDLQNRVLDRKFTEQLCQIQSLISSVQSENASLIKETIDLKSENFELKKKIIEFEEPSHFSAGASIR